MDEFSGINTKVGNELQPSVVNNTNISKVTSKPATTNQSEAHS